MNSKLITMPKYEAYKDSGVDWLGDMPSDWDLIANKHIFKLKKRLVGKRSSQYDLLSLTLRGILKRDMENPEGKFPAEFDTYQEVAAGDFIFCLFDVEETPRTVGLSLFDGMITGAYTVFECLPEFDQRFLYYFYLNLDGSKRMKPLYKGLRNTIPKDAFLSFKTFIPEKSIQTTIANFLDQKTTQIDEAIAIKEKQIALLKERKQIIIQKAVTGEIVWNEQANAWAKPAEVKDSGVDWIGQIPEHWQVISSRHLARKITDGEHISPTFTDSGMPFLSAKDIRENEIIFPDNKFVKVRDGKKFRLRCNPERGDILLVSRGATIGRVSKVNTDKEFCLLGSVILIKPKVEKVLSDFLLWAFACKSLQTEFLSTSDFSAQQAIYLVKVSATKVPIPPIEEQAAIAEKLEVSCAELDKSNQLITEQILKLKEYKTTLINSAVTGKIKVA